MSILKTLRPFCQIVDCEREQYAKGMCFKHYQRMLRNGTLQTLHKRGSLHHFWRGGTRSDRGRIQIYSPNHPRANSVGYIYRYRLVAEEKLGRILEAKEIVHHKDRNCTNDVADNLEVSTQSVHASNHNQNRPRNSKGQFTK